MRPFRAVDRGYVAELDATERIVLAQVVGDVAQMLTDLDAESVAPGDDVDADGRLDEDDREIPLDALPPHGTTPEAVRPPDDPALARLLPDASLDPEVAVEFRRLTQSDVASSKAAGLLHFAHLLLAEEPAVGERAPLVVVRDDARAVATALTDVRLVLASRLGLETDEDAEELHDWVLAVDEAEGADDDLLPTDAPRRFLAGVFLTAGWLQESLVEQMITDLPPVRRS